MRIVYVLQHLLIIGSLMGRAVPAAAQGMQEAVTPAAAFDINPGYGSLVDQLRRDGFDPSYLAAVFADRRARFLPDVLFINLTGKYRAADYTRFTGGASVRQARHFLNEESAYLERVEKQFQVNKEVIVSILCVESDLGKNTGSNLVFNVFSTLALAADPAMLSTVTDRIAGSYPQMSRAELEQRARKKSAWAYQELKSLLTIARGQDTDPLRIKGSWAGAFGMAQFLPSSYARFARDGNGDGRINLHDRYDAMASVANYLKSHGWRPDATEAEKRSIIRKYNNSRAYTEAVLGLARLVEENR